MHLSFHSYRLLKKKEMQLRLGEQESVGVSCTHKSHDDCLYHNIQARLNTTTNSTSNLGFNALISEAEKDCQMPCQFLTIDVGASNFRSETTVAIHMLKT